MHGVGFGLFFNADHGEHNGVYSVEISKTFSKVDVIFCKMEAF